MRIQGIQSDYPSYKLIGVDHVCLVATDLSNSLEFYVKGLGLEQTSIPHVLKVSSTFAIHLCDLPKQPVEVPEGWPLEMSSWPISARSWTQQINHVALRVNSIAFVVKHLLAKQIQVFQMDKDGNRQEIRTATQPLNFGLKSAYCYDPSGNLIELVDEKSLTNEE